MLDPATLQNASVLVIGVGAIGRPTALTLAQMGVGTLYLVDPDSVSDVNLGVQGFRPDQLDELKVDAMCTDISLLNPACVVTASTEKFSFMAGKYEGLGEMTDNHCRSLSAVICCADSMTARREAHEFCKHFNIPLFIDTRMGAEVLRLFISTRSEKSRLLYEESLFSDHEAAPLTCTTRSTPYCATLASSLAVTIFAQHLRSFPLPSSLNFSLPALDLSVID